MGDAYKRSRLLEAGFPPPFVDAVARAMAPVGDVPLFETVRPSDALTGRPLLVLTGLPADIRPRELRLMVCSLPGFRAASLATRNGVPTAYVWWNAQADAQCAVVVLRHLTLEAGCPCPLHRLLPPHLGRPAPPRPPRPSSDGPQQSPDEPRLD